MHNETLGQRVGLIVETFVVDHIMFFIIFGLIVVVALDIYNRFFCINRNTPNVDMGQEYANLLLRRRYKL